MFYQFWETFYSLNIWKLCYSLDIDPSNSFLPKVMHQSYTLILDCDNLTSIIVQCNFFPSYLFFMYSL